MPTREFVDFANAVTGDTLSGNKLSRAPESSGSVSVGYVWPIRQRGSLSVRVDYNYRSRFFFTKEHDPIAAQGAFGLLDVFLQFDSARDRGYAFASARNVLDTAYFDRIFAQSSPGCPAHYEAGLGFRF